MISQQKPSTWLLLLAFLTIYIVWGSSYIAIHFATETIPPFFMMGTRLGLAGLVLTLLARRGGAAFPTRPQWRSAAIAGFFLFVLNAGAIAYAVANLGMPSGMAAVLLATTPLWMVLLNWLRRGGTAPTGQTMIGVIVGFVGIVILVNPGGESTITNPLGALAILFAAICWTGGSLYMRGADLAPSPTMATGTQLLCGGVMLVGVSLITGELNNFDPSLVTFRSVAAMIYLGIFNSALGFSAYVWLLRVTTPSRVATYAYVNPVVAVILGAVLANEMITGQAVLAGVIILFSVLLINMQRLPSMQRLRVRLQAQLAKPNA